MQKFIRKDILIVVVVVEENEGGGEKGETPQTKGMGEV